MSDDELFEAIDWLYGGHDQFQLDDLLKESVSKIIHDEHEQGIRVLTRYVKKLTEPPFTVEDVKAFIDFLDYYLDWA